MSRRPLRHPLASALLVLVLAWTTQASATPITFTASGANAAGIQGSVDAFRAALGNPDNGNAGPQAGGHREINWDGGGATNGTAAVTPFTVFQNTRGATFTTPGSGLTQAPISGGTVDIAPGVGDCREACPLSTRPTRPPLRPSARTGSSRRWTAPSRMEHFPFPAVRAPRRRQ